MTIKNGWIEEEGVHQLYIQNNPVAYVEETKSVKGHKVFLWAAVDYLNQVWTVSKTKWYSRGGEATLKAARTMAEIAAYRIFTMMAEHLKKRVDFHGEEPAKQGNQEEKLELERFDTPDGEIIVFPGAGNE